MKPIPWVLAAFLLALFAPASIEAQTSRTGEPGPTGGVETIQVERLAALGKLWGTVKYFHPTLAYIDVDWDAALVAAIPRVRAARSGAEYAAAVQEMLGALNDPATRVVPIAADVPPSTAGPKAPIDYRWTEDSVLVASVSDYAGLVDYVGMMEALTAIAEQIPRARAVVFDLRSPRATTQDERDMFSLGLGWTGVEGLMSTTALTTPGERSRIHRGFATQEGTTSGAYSSALLVTDGRLIRPAPGAVDRRVVFLIDENSALPAVALALQESGRGAIVGEGNASDGPAVRLHPLVLPDGIAVQIRLGELVYGDGVVGLSLDAVVPAAARRDGRDGALERALELARSPGPLPRRSAPAPARAVSTADRAYAEMRYPPAEYRLLAAFRIWNVFQHFFPYRDLMDRDWAEVLLEFIPRMEAARDSLEYALAVAEMVAHVQDTHAFVVSPVLRGHFGAATPPVVAQMVEGLPVVTFLYDAEAARQAGIGIGDVILRVDGEDLRERLQRISRYMAASTPQSLHANALRSALLGSEGSEAVLTIRDGEDRIRETRVRRTAEHFRNYQGMRGGEILRLLPGNMGYADLDRLTVPMVDSMFDLFKDTPAIIFDMRGYPNGTAWVIAPRLTERVHVPAARFIRPMPTRPSGPNGELAESWTLDEFVQRLPQTDQPRYSGRTVMLIDEHAISQAEHTGLFLKAANGTTFIGSPTMGANGDVTNFNVPGGIQVYFTGQGVSYPDGRQLQRVGLLPDVEARPTIRGIREGRDEILERALEYLAPRGAQ
jgi:C-terminal processing protease CtpA/Prc